MKRISSAEFVRSFSHHADAAPTDPVVITHHGRDRLVLLSVDTYRDLLALAEADDIAAGEAVCKSSRGSGAFPSPVNTRRCIGRSSGA